jgi:hypothetical protein
MPDQEMIERVAKAIALRDTTDEFAMARAAIKAIREPTQAMMNAAIYKGVDCGFGCGYPEYEDVYKATIDSILND